MNPNKFFKDELILNAKNTICEENHNVVANKII